MPLRHPMRATPTLTRPLPVDAVAVGDAVEAAGGVGAHNPIPG